MEDADVMQADQASVAGSIANSEQMELEHEDQHTIRDSEMEIHDLEAEGTIEEMKDAIVHGDAEMTAEMLEQERLQEEREWKDVPVQVIPLDGPAQDVKPIQAELANGDQDNMDGMVNGVTSTSEDKAATPQAQQVSEAGQLTLEDFTVKTPSGSAEVSVETVEGTSASQSGSAEAQKASQSAHDHDLPPIAQCAEDLTVPPAVDDGGIVEGEEYTDADELQTTYEPVASTSAQVQAVQSGDAYESPINRPDLQKDFLKHVDVYSGSAALFSTSTETPGAPHVSLIYNNEMYSLFRPSSQPSGEDEAVLFDQDEDQTLYFANLESLISRLHQTFPHFKGEGDNELILDFGILDMQLSEDNVYTRQISLHDMDRLRLGMCQPELDRLQVSMRTGKRFVYQFNELAEHVYRMGQGDDIDANTVYEETVDEQQEDADAAEDYDDEDGLAHEAADEQFTVDEDAEVEEEEPLEYQDDATGEAKSAEEAEGDATEQGQVEIADLADRKSSSADAPGEHDGEIHPPSDDYYEDPEFSQRVEEEENAEEDAEDDEDDSATVQGHPEEAERDNAEEVEDAEELTIDPNAPLDEVAEQIDEYEEEVYEHEEDEAAEAKADAHADGDAALSTDTSVNIKTNEQENQDHYAKLDSFAPEEQVKISGDASVASQLEEYEAAPQVELETVTTTNGSAKRTRDDEDLGDAATGDSASVDAGSTEHNKRAKVSA